MPRAIRIEPSVRSIHWLMTGLLRSAVAARAARNTSDLDDDRHHDHQHAEHEQLQRHGTVVRTNELWQERHEEDRRLRIQQIDQYALPIRLPGRCARSGIERQRGSAARRTQRLKTEIEQIGGTDVLHHGESERRGGEDRRDTQRRECHMHQRPAAHAACRHDADATTATQGSRQHIEQVWPWRQIQRQRRRKEHQPEDGITHRKPPFDVRRDVELRIG